MLIIMAGLPASGKSMLARALADRLAGAVLDKDAIRAALFQAGDVEYSAAQDDLIMDLMLQAARFLLQKDPARIVFLDGRTFSHAYQRQRAIDFAETLPTPWSIIECVCSEASARERLRASGDHPAANRTFALWQNVRATFEPIPPPKLLIDTDQPLDDCLSKALQAIASK